MPANPLSVDGSFRCSGDDLCARLSFLSVCAFALAVVLNVFAATLLASLGMTLLAISFDERAKYFSRFISKTRLTAALVSVALIAALVPDPLHQLPTPWVAVVIPLIVIPFAVAELTSAWTGRHPIVTGATVILIALVTGISLIQAAKGTGIDVVQLHRQAATALARGENPYGAAVSVANGSPHVPPGSTIVGYPYPPMVALAYGTSMWVSGEPRWAGLASWIVLALCGLELFRGRRNWSSALPFLLLVALPGWGMMLQSGWTEMLSAALIALAAVTWEWPVASGLALGAALGSKQYFIVALPLIALYRGHEWRRRAAAALAAAAVSLLPAFAWSPLDAWRSLVLFHAHTSPRTDGGNLVGVLGLLGVHWNPPLWLSLGVSLTLVSLLGKRATASPGFWRAMAAGLAAFLLFSTQAMPNYWFLVAVIAVFGCQCDRHSFASGYPAP